MLKWGSGSQWCVLEESPVGIAKSIIRADWEQDSNYEIVMKNGLFVALPNPVPIFVLKGFFADTVICCFFLNDVGLEKRRLFFRPPDTQPMWCLLPSFPPSPLQQPASSARGSADLQPHSSYPSSEAASNNTCRFTMSKPTLLAAHRKYRVG